MQNQNLIIYTSKYIYEYLKDLYILLSTSQNSFSLYHIYCNIPYINNLIDIAFKIFDTGFSITILYIQDSSNVIKNEHIIVVNKANKLLNFYATKQKTNTPKRFRQLQNSLLKQKNYQLRYFMWKFFGVFT